VKLRLIVAAALAAAVLAAAAPYVDEGFENGVPPPRWTSTKSGVGAGWDPEEGGPWGKFAVGWASSSAGAERWARMETFGFEVPPDTTLTFRFNYKYGHGGFEAENRATFSLLYATQPEEVFASRAMAPAAEWRVLSARTPATRAGTVKARFEVWVLNRHPQRVATYAWDLDNVVVDASEPAVSPTSLGRVKALFN
jgi:hypothetical protein